jgi:hypothetical protein
MYSTGLASTKPEVQTPEPPKNENRTTKQKKQNKKHVKPIEDISYLRFPQCSW